MKAPFRGFILCIFLTLLFSSCEKNEASPDAKLEGTWRITSFVAVNPSTEQEVNFITEIAAFFPCIKESLITFSGGSYFTSIPEDCVSEDGESLQIFPSASSGTYTILEDGTFNLDDNGFLYEGIYRFDGNRQFVFTIGEGAEKLTITFEKE